MFNLKGKVALVTGGASGIGLAFVKKLLGNELKGVAILDVNNTSGLRAQNELQNDFGQNRVTFIKTDVGDKKEFEAAFEQVIGEFGQLDIVMNNAGILQELDWEKCVAVNLTGVMTGCMLAMEKYLPKYKSGSEGVIVNTASIAGLRPTTEGPIYASTKFGVVGLTRSLGTRMRYEETKVRVLGICPGPVETPILSATEAKVPEPYLSRFHQMIKMYPKQRPEVFASNVVGVIKDAPTGSIWMTMAEDSFKRVQFPKY